MTATDLPPWRVERFDAVESTNDAVKARVAEGEAAGLVVVAARQVAGRGRFGRAWASPRGGLYCSFLLKADLDRVPLITLAGGLAVRDALPPLDVSVGLKWPNDVLVDGGKVAGILVEGLVGPEGYWAVVGVGVNSDVPLERIPPRTEMRATTLRHVLGRRVDNPVLLDRILDRYRAHHPYPGQEGEVVDRYREACVTLGRDVVARTPQGTVAGRAVDVSDRGFLLLEMETGKRVEVAEASLRPRE